MNPMGLRPSRLAAGLAILLVVVLAAGACATRLASESHGDVSMAAAAPATPDAAATISANLRTALPATAPTAAPLSPLAAAASPATRPQNLRAANAPAFLLPTATPTPLPAAAPTATPTAQFEPTPDGVARTVKVPILMYHYISVPPADADIYRVDLSVPPDLFAAHLDRLQAEGYTTISLYQLLAHLTQGVPLPQKPVVITFDDGYRDVYENAFPVLRAHGMTATFFVITDFLDEQRPLYLSWDMAREMLAAGMSIESHSRNHFTLKGQNDDYLVWQALGSLETLQYELGVRPRFISYPAGDYDQRTIDVFKSANYWGGLTTEQGTEQSSEHPFELERIRVRATTTPDDLIRYMEADW
jgi:peptidoglycan/xylan/chitin deacetylase (PgdA/CDA1 family)